MIVLMFLGCVERRVMPAFPEQPVLYHVEMTATFTNSADDLSDPVLAAMNSTVSQDWTISLTPQGTRSDDTILFQMQFVEATTKIGESPAEVSSLVGSELYLRCFPWGELLTIEGMENVVGQGMELDAFDVIFPALFPNPPRYSKQQWQYRILSVPMRIDDLRVGRQFVEADWSKSSKDTWTYSGEWNVDARLERTYPLNGGGVVRGIVQSGPALIDRHELEWVRTLDVHPISRSLQQEQTFTVLVERQQ